MATRQDYMNGIVTHAEYYRDVNAAAGLTGWPYERSISTQEIRDALARGDEHLNSIALTRWDGIAAHTRPILSPAFKDRGDFWSLGGAVCALKQAAKDHVARLNAGSE